MMAMTTISSINVKPEPIAVPIKAGRHDFNPLGARPVFMVLPAVYRPIVL
jgi:hypothetical protein